MNLVELAASSWNFRLIYHVTTGSIVEFEKEIGQVNLKILRLMEKEGVELPYPKYQLLLEAVDEDVQLDMNAPGS